MKFKEKNENGKNNVSKPEKNVKKRREKRVDEHFSLIIKKDI